MKSAIYIEQGITQFVLTPESDIDKQVLDQIEKAKGMNTCRGSFYECRGGWMRYKERQGYSPYGLNASSDDSLIFMVREVKETEQLGVSDEHL
jgi:hypothetical protein